MYTGEFAYKAVCLQTVRTGLADFCLHCAVFERWRDENGVRNVCAEANDEDENFSSRRLKTEMMGPEC